MVIRMKKIWGILLSLLLAAGMMRPCLAYEPKTAEAVKATAIVDAEMEEIWQQTDVLKVELVNKTIIYQPDHPSQATAEVRLLWDERYLYVFAVVRDPTLFTGNELGSSAFIADGIEFQIDEGNDKSGKNNVGAGNPAAGSFQIFADGSKSGFGALYTAGASGFRYAIAEEEDGYTAEAAIPWNTLAPKVGGQIGFEIQINDNITGQTREGLVSWNSDACLGWQDTEAMGTITLVDSPEGYVPPVTEPPATELPATEPPATEAPATEAPSGALSTGTQQPGSTPASTEPGENSPNGTLTAVLIVAAVVVVAAVVTVLVRKKK